MLNVAGDDVHIAGLEDAHLASDAHFELAFDDDAALLMGMRVQGHQGAGFDLHQGEEHLGSPEGARAGAFGEFFVATALGAEEVVAHKL